MNVKNTALWLLLAAGLFAFIFFYQRHAHKNDTGPAKILPDLKPDSITSIQVLPKGIRAERTNHLWVLTEPLVYPGQSASIENFLATLERLTAATYITEHELKNRFNADEEYGFASPQASIILQPGDFRLRIGKKTAPGDQVFVQNVRDDGIYVVDATLLNFIPQNLNDWRDTTLIDLKSLTFDRVSVTNGANGFTLQRDAGTHLWRMLFPMQTRADHVKIEDSLQKLQQIRIRQFVSDDPKADLEALGLQPPKFEIAFAQGTNNVALFQFGQSPTNANAVEFFARRVGQRAIVSVSKDLLASWQAPYEGFRDPHLLVLAAPVDIIDIRGQDNFSLQRLTNNTWLLLSNNFPLDATSLQALLDGLSNLRVAAFTKDFVTEPDLRTYGLAFPTRQYILKSAVPQGGTGASNAVIAEVSFGTNQNDTVFARRADESSVYAVKLSDLERLPSASWQLRERQIWNISETEVAAVAINQSGKTRRLIHNGPYKWSFAPGSQGTIDGLREEETVRGLCHLAAQSWVARGAQNREHYGFTNPQGGAHTITLELKNGEKLTVEFSRPVPSQLPNSQPSTAYGGVTLEGEFWIFEFPPLLCRDLLAYLTS